MRTQVLRTDTKKYAKAHAKFREDHARWLMDRGAAVSPHWYNHKIETNLGTLYVSTHKDGMPSIYSRFDEPDRARSAGKDCNPYSGKWNFSGDTHAEVSESFRRELARILPEPA